MSVTKEAIAIVLDIGVSMHEGKESPSVLEKAKSCIDMIIQRKIFSESKDEITLILFGTDETKNSLAELHENQYKHIKVCQDLKPASWELLEFVNEIQGTKESADYIRDKALLVAIDLLQNPTNGKKFFSRRILFLSRFDGAFSDDNAIRICDELKTNKIDLNIIGPLAYSDEDINSRSDTPAYQNRTPIEIRAEDTVRRILNEVNGESYSFSDALPALIYYQKKKVQALPWNANLDIGTNLTIPISAYTKVSESKAKSWKNSYAHKINAKIEKGTSYVLNDDDQTKVPKESIIPAFKYGTTLVPYTEEDKMNMDYQSGEKGMKVLGFTKTENVQRYHYIGDKSMYVFGQKNRELAGVILAPFIQALNDTKMVAIVRYVYSPRSAPKIGFLAPKIKPNYECLVFITLPFMEDLCHFVFSPLDADPKNLPSDEQLNAIDHLITSMDLTTTVDEDGNKSEDLKPKNTVNPHLQRLYQCLQYKAFNPEKPLPDLSPQIEAIMKPSSKVLEKAEFAFKEIQSVFPLKELSQQKTDTTLNLFSNGKSETIQRKRKLSDDSGIESKLSIVEDVNDLVTKVGTVNPLRDFHQIVKQQEIPFNEAVTQLTDVVWTYLQDDSNIKLYHSKIISICKDLLKTSIAFQEPVKYNAFMIELQSKLLKSDPELWNKIKYEKIGLITKGSVECSEISEAYAETFIKTEASDAIVDIKSEEIYSAAVDDNNDYDALLDQL